MAYNYGPPPPAPPPAPPSSAPAGYPSYGPPRGGHSGRGRGGSDRGGYHQPHHGYNYGHQQPAYGHQTPAPYTAPAAQSGYPQPPQQQSWHHDHSQQQQHPQSGASHTLPAQNYHPNYAPQIYQPPQQQQGYAGQPPYQPAPQPPYGQPYAAPAPSGPPAQQWGAHSQPPASHGGYSGGGRGGRGGYSDRNAPKGQLMGPPIRMGFDAGQPQATPAPVSAPYPYGTPPTPPAPYPSPYQGYPAPAPYMPTPQSFDGRSGHGARHHGRGGFQHNKSRGGHFGGDKNRGRNNNNHHGQNKSSTSQSSPAQQQQQKSDAASAGKKKKRKTNTLGLTPGDESDEDDENEEERLNEMYGADAPNPQTSADIAAWIAERRSRFPTKSRIEARKAAVKAQTNEAQQAKSSALEQKAEKLRKQLEKVESSIKRKREQQDEGDDMRDIDLSSPSSEIKSEDEKPEVMSTRQALSSIPPPPRKADPTKHCKYYSTGGTCGKRGKCRFVHDPAVREAALKEREMNGGRITLQQRITLNDKDQEDLAIVETLKYLQDRGVLPNKGPNGEASDDQPEETNLATEGEPSDTPANGTSANGLPPIPPAPISSDNTDKDGNSTKYPGWNLSGFGNTGVTPSE